MMRHVEIQIILLHIPRLAKFAASETYIDFIIIYKLAVSEDTVTFLDYKVLPKFVFHY